MDTTWLLVVVAPPLLAATAVAAIGWALLVLALILTGVGALRRDRRSPFDALALLAGIGLLLLPATFHLLDPLEVTRDDPAVLVRYSAHVALVLIVAEVGLSFAAFLGASALYRWRRTPVVPEAIVVLGAGLRDGDVSPLLARRLERGLRTHREQAGRPAIITAGGQGPDEPRPEGTAMREYLLARGAAPDQVLAETQSRNTEENLRLSRRLLDTPDAPVEIVTSGFHVLRTALLARSLGMRAHVVGSRTDRTYLPGALLRELAAIVRDHVRLHATVVALLVALAVALALVVVPASGTPTG